MEFTFNFMGDSDSYSTVHSNFKSDTSVLCSEDVCIDFTTLDNTTFVPLVVGNLNLQRVDDCSESNYDLIPGVYEGGSKVWECSVDLSEYLLDKSISGCALELGCGHGFPGIIALLKGCYPVVFTDYNSNVLRNVTWPNIIRNCPQFTTNAKCIGGDWVTFSKQAENNCDGTQPPLHYDIILSAETLYTVAHCHLIYNMIEKHLRPSHSSIALIASKRYYFGVGGGTQELMNLFSNNKNFNCAVVREFEDGMSNIREIIAISPRVLDI